jgi:hypothetical protein
MAQFDIKQMIKEKQARDAAQAPVSNGAEPESQFIRKALQGATFEFWDEIEAAARSAVNGFSNYEEVRDDIRQKIKAYEQANPGEALSAEILGAAAPTALLMLIPGGQGVGAANIARMTTGQLVRRGTAVGAGEGALQAYGSGEQGALEDIARIPGGAATGAATSATLGVAAPKIQNLAGDFLDFARRRLQGRPTGAVQSEIQRLMEVSGMDADEVVNGLLSGRIMADNPALAATLREYRSRGATVDVDGQRISLTEATSRRAGQKATEAQEAIQEGMTPGMGENVFATFKTNDKEFADQQRKAYQQIFEGSDAVVSADTVDAMSEAFARIPKLAQKLQDRYKARGGLVPFYDEKLLRETGELRIVRQPTIEDAEILRRTVQNEVDNAYAPMSEIKDLGPAFKEIETKLRTSLDADAPDLASTRQNWSRLSKGRENFKEGNKVWSKNSDEVAYDFDLLSSDPVAARSFRAGAMNALRQKIRKTPSVFKRLSQEGSAENEILRTLFPGENIEEVIRKADLAATTRVVSQKVDPTAQSITADQLAARQREGTGPMGVFDALGVATLDPQSLARAGQAISQSFNVSLSPQQRNQVVDILFSEDPEIVERAIRGGGFTERQMERIGNVVSATVEGARSAVTRQAGELGGQTAETYAEGIF